MQVKIEDVSGDSRLWYCRFSAWLTPRRQPSMLLGGEWVPDSGTFHAPWGSTLSRTADKVAGAEGMIFRERDIYVWSRPGVAIPDYELTAWILNNAREELVELSVFRLGEHVQGRRSDGRNPRDS